MVRCRLSFVDFWKKEDENFPKKEKIFKIGFTISSFYAILSMYVRAYTIIFGGTEREMPYLRIYKEHSR